VEEDSTMKRDGGNYACHFIFLMRRQILLFCLCLLLFPTYATSISFPFNKKNKLLGTAAGFNNPCLGRAKQKNVEYYVIGTSHFQSKSAEDVSSIIEEIKPDGVVLELDAERTVRLTKEQCTNIISEKKEDNFYGGDFLAAIDTSRKSDIPLFLGDEAPKMTLERLVETATVLESYNPAVLGTFFRSTSASSSQKINFLSVFVSDPRKAGPLLLTLPSIFALLFSFQNYQWGDISSNAETFAAIFVSLLATSKVLNTLIVDRDEILASSAIRAAKVIESLRKKETLRKRWTFTVDNCRRNPEMKRDTYVGDGVNECIPIFTLKTQLELGQNRNLNLFEPRWLQMIDSLSEKRRSDSVLKESPQFITVTCPNKFYSSVAVNGSEGRYADIIFSKEGRMATLLETKEGNRPSGDRRISCKIEGGEKVIVDEGNASVRNEGYMVMEKRKLSLDSSPVVVESCEKRDAKKIKIVVVVGLLHANGIIDRLSEST